MSDDARGRPPADPPNTPAPPAGEGDDAPTDPDEAELVAYLDGELDTGASRRVAARLAADPVARAKAAALKKSFDLLDFLPRPDPSPNFAHRTLDKLPAAGRPPSVPAPHFQAPGSPTPAPVLASSAPSASAWATAGPPPRGRGWSWAVGGLAAVALAVGAGYAGHAAARTFFFPPAGDANLSLEADRRVVENLPLYAGVDDFNYLARLTEGETFADDLAPPADAPPVPPEVARAAGESPWGENLEPLIRAFKALPVERQKQVRVLDQRLHDQPPADRDRLTRVLEAYAVWLARLPDAERAAVLAAATPDLRFKVVADIREAQWQARLTDGQRKALAALPPAERGALTQQWKGEQADRKRAWLLRRQNWETIRADRPPWPFDTDAGRKGVADYVRTTLRVEGTASGRLTGGEAERLRAAQEMAEREGEWLNYGAAVLALADKYPSLPEPVGRPVLVVADLPQPFRARLVKGGGERKALNAAAGKWPEFALAVADDAQKAGLSAPIPLGPARPADFREPARHVVEGELLPRLGDEERGALVSLEGKWPAYPLKVMELARKTDLPVPGVTLPGLPSLWEKTYRVTRPGGRVGPS